MTSPVSRDELINAAFREAIRSGNVAIEPRHLFVAAWELGSQRGKLRTDIPIIEIRRALELNISSTPYPPQHANIRRFTRGGDGEVGVWRVLVDLFRRRRGNVVRWSTEAEAIIASASGQEDVDLFVLSRAFPALAGPLAQIGLTGLGRS